MNNQRGLIKLIAVMVIAIIILSYFQVDVRKVIESEAVQQNFHYLWGLVSKVWNSVAIELIWNNFQHFIERLSHNLTPIQ